MVWDIRSYIGFKNVGEEIGLGSAQRTDVQIIALSSWKKEDEISSSENFSHERKN